MVHLFLVHFFFLLPSVASPLSFSSPPPLESEIKWRRKFSFLLFFNGRQPHSLSLSFVVANTFMFTCYRAGPCKNKLTHEEQLACKVNETYHYHAYEVSVHSCMRSLWCTSLALLTHTPACFPHVHSCGRLAAQWLQAQQRKVCVLMPRLAWVHKLWHGSFDMVARVSWQGMTDVLPSSEMIELDGDEERISSQGRYAERDIVQVQIIPRDMAVGLFAQHNVSQEMWDLLLMGKGHGAWPSALLLFLSPCCCLPFLKYTYYTLPLCPFNNICSLLLPLIWYITIPSLLVSLFPFLSFFALLFLFPLLSSFLSETTLIGEETTSLAWLVWLKKCLLKSRTSSCPTWEPGGSNLGPCPLLTPPVHHQLSTPSSLDG